MVWPCRFKKRGSPLSNTITNQQVKQKKEKLWSMYFILLATMYLFQSMGFSILNNVMALYVEGLFGKSVYAGYLNAAFGAAAIIARMVGGYFTDRFPRRAVMTITTVIYALGTLMFGLCSVFGLLMFFRFVQGLGFAAAGTATTAATADVVPKSRFAEGMGKIGLGSAIASALGSSVILLIAGEAGHYNRAVLFAAAMLFVAAAMAALCAYEKKPFYVEKRKQERQQALLEKQAESSIEYKGIEKVIEKTALPPAIIQFFTQFSFSCLNTFLLAYAVSKGFSDNVSYYFTLSAAAMFLSSLFAGQLVDRFGVRKVALPCLALSIASYAILGTTGSVVLFCLTGLTFGLSNGVMNVVMQSEGVRHAEPARRGAASGTFMLSSDIANAIGGIFWGALIDRSGYTMAFVGACAFVAVAVVLVIVLFRGKKAAGPLVTTEP